MRELLADNASSLAQQRSRLHQALIGRTPAAGGADVEAADAPGVQDGHSQAEDPAGRDVEVLAQWAAFMQGSKVMQVCTVGQAAHA